MLVLIAVAAMLPSQTQTLYTKTIDSLFDLSIYMDTTTSDTIVFELTMSNSSWFAIGFGVSMVEMPCLIYEGTTNVSARWSHYRGKPSVYTWNMT